MNKIELLIEQLCPDGVKFKNIADIAIVGTGKSNGNEAVENGKYPLFVRSKHVKRINTFEFDEEAIIIPGEGGIGEIFHYINGKYALHQRAYRIHLIDDEISTKFVYYYMMSNFKKFILRKVVSSTVGSIRKPMIENFPIPFPPLPIQQEIVSILDKFVQLDVELNAELEARKKQYQYYINKLFNFEGKEVEWKTLGELGKLTRGKRFVKKDVITEGIPCIHYGEMYTHYDIWAKESISFLDENLASKLRVAHPGDVVIVAAGETIEDIGKGVAWLGDSDVVTHDACFTFSHNLEPKYVSYYLQSKIFRSQIKRYISSGKISSINAFGLSKAKIPIPSVKVQKEIVSILDNFRTLVNDTFIGIPAEIEARRKQYEYYRAKLLDFKEC